jgi:hypothetical protein
MDVRAKQLLCYHKTKAASFNAHGYLLIDYDILNV